MACPHSVLESVEFAEGDSFLDAPDTEHHFDCFYIVGSVVLWVIYLFHIPYQIYWCKDRKTLRISQRGGIDKSYITLKISNLFAEICRINYCKYSGYKWKNKAFAYIIEQGCI